MKTLRKIMGIIATIASVMVTITAAFIMAITLYVGITGGELILVLMSGEIICTCLLCVLIPVVMFKISNKIMGY